MPKLNKPVFIIGTGRCGSTIFHRMMAHHPHLAWLSRYTATAPAKLNRSRRAMMALDSPMPGRLTRKLVYPVEAYSFWERVSPGFSEPCRDLRAADVTPPVRARLQKTLPRLLTRRRQRLLIKITGWPRVGFLKEVFPDAKFIHVYRDGRAVVNSLLAVPWWSGWRGPSNWRWGKLSAGQREKWRRHRRSFVALAAIEWEILMTAHAQAQKAVPAEDYMEIRYEALCAAPQDALRQAADFCELPWTDDFQAATARFSLKNTNYKWQKDLTAAQQQILNDCLADSLHQYEYV